MARLLLDRQQLPLFERRLNDLQPDSERLWGEMSPKRLVEQAESEPSRRVRHPFFGMLTLRQWQRMHALHMDHHLRQFGA